MWESSLILVTIEDTKFFCLALAHMLEMCRDHFRSLVMVAPMYLTDSATVVFILCNSYHIIAIITNSYVVCTFHLQKFMKQGKEGFGLSGVSRPMAFNSYLIFDYSWMSFQSWFTHNWHVASLHDTSMYNATAFCDYHFLLVTIVFIAWGCFITLRTGYWYCKSVLVD